MPEQHESVTAPGRDERLAAALSHALVLASSLGAIGAAVIYALSRERNRPVAFQAAQAALYQLLTVVISILAWTCWTGVYLLSLAPMMAHPSAYPEPPWFFWAGMASMLLPLRPHGAVGAVRTLGGRALLAGASVPVRPDRAVARALSESGRRRWLR